MNDRYNRSSSYRNEFFKRNKGYWGLYFCAYCGFPHRKRTITIDHVIPIHAVHTKWLARRYLDLHRMTINDPSNLVPSCRRCNRRKGANLTLYWIIKAKFSKIPYSWVFTWLFRIAILFVIILLVFR